MARRDQGLPRPYTRFDGFIVSFKRVLFIMMPSDVPRMGVPPSAATVASSPLHDARQALRRRLRATREKFVASAAAVGAAEALEAKLLAVLTELEPECLGLYWPLPCEFNAARPWRTGPQNAALPLALPFAQRTPRAMHYRRWDGRQPPSLQDECGIASVDGAPIDPDVLLVPCLGYTDGMFRLGHGGGYFDRYLARHPGVTAVGIAWSACRLEEGDFAPEPHDLPMALIVTEQGVVG